jgi:hypothetical protein
VDEALGLGVVGDEELLIALSSGEMRVVQLDAETFLEEEQQLEKGHAVPDASTDVEGLAAGFGDVFVRRNVGGDGVGDVEEIVAGGTTWRSNSNTLISSTITGPWYSHTPIFQPLRPLLAPAR